MMDCRIVALCLALSMVMAAAMPAVLFEDSMEKKSDGLGQFMAAMRGAQRLRYGKRSAPSEYDVDAVPLYPVRMMLAKRMTQNLPELIDSLNGAERLRFGK